MTESKSTLLSSAAKFVAGSHPVRLLAVVTSAGLVHLGLAQSRPFLEGDFATLIANGIAILIFLSESAVLAATVVSGVVKSIRKLDQKVDSDHTLTDLESKVLEEQLKLEICELKRQQAFADLETIKLRAEALELKNRMLDNRYPITSIEEIHLNVFGFSNHSDRNDEEPAVFGL